MKTVKIKTNILLIGLIFFAIFFVPVFPKAQAIEYGLLGGRPANPDPKVENSSAWFIYNLEPGQSKEDSIEIMNLFEEPLEVMVYAADSVHSSSGGFALRQFSEPKEQVGSWVKFYTTNPPEYFSKVFEKLDKKIINLCGQSKEDLTKKMEESGEIEEGEEVSEEKFNELKEWCKGEESFKMTLKSKEHIFTPFVFSVPQGTDVGEHTGGILIQKTAAEDAGESNGSAVKLTTRVGVRIYQTVPGEIVKKLSLESFEVKKNFKELDLSRFFFAKWFGKGNSKPEDYLMASNIKNEGNVSVEFEEKIIVKDIFFGKRNQEIDRNYQVLKNDVFISNYSWESPRFGYFEFSKVIKYKDNGGSQQSISTNSIKKLILPIREMLLALILGVVVGIIYLGRKIYINKKYNLSKWEKYTIEEGDDINTLADFHEIDWEVLAKINKIKPPFKLVVGDEIKVPLIGGEESNEGGEDGEQGGVGEDDSNIESEIKSENNETKSEIIKGGSSIAETLWEDFGNKGEQLNTEFFAEERTEGSQENNNINTISANKGEIKEEMEEETDDEKRMREYLLNKKIKRLWISVSVLAGALVVGIVIFFVFFRSDKNSVPVVVENKPVASSEPLVQQDTPKAEDSTKEENKSQEADNKKADFSNVNVVVLNGSSVSGAAGKMKEDIAIKDETIKNIEAKNAEGEYPGETKLYYEEEFKLEAEKLAEMLNEKYGKIEVTSIKNIPSAESKNNIVIIIGSK